MELSAGRKTTWAHSVIYITVKKTAPEAVFFGLFAHCPAPFARLPSPSLQLRTYFTEVKLPLITSRKAARNDSISARFTIVTRM